VRPRFNAPPLSAESLISLRYQEDLRVYSLVGYFGSSEKKIGAFDIIALYFGKLASAQFSLPVHRDAFKLDLL
jgi:hypothetical protein